MADPGGKLLLCKTDSGLRSTLLGENIDGSADPIAGDLHLPFPGAVVFGAERRPDATMYVAAARAMAGAVMVATG